MAFECPHHSHRRDFGSSVFLPFISEFQSYSRPQVRFLPIRSRQSSRPETNPQRRQRFAANRSEREDDGELFALTPSELLENLMDNWSVSHENKKPEGKENPVIEIKNSKTDLCLSHCNKRPFEVNVNLNSVDPEKVKVEVKDGVLQIEGRKVSSEGSFTFVRHQQTIPRNVDPSRLKASLLSEGILKVCEERKQMTSLPIKISDETNSQTSTKEEETESAKEAEIQQTQT